MLNLKTICGVVAELDQVEPICQVTIQKGGDILIVS